jgi:hypothetical protein
MYIDYIMTMQLIYDYLLVLVIHYMDKLVYGGIN